MSRLVRALAAVGMAAYVALPLASSAQQPPAPGTRCVTIARPDARTRCGFGAVREETFNVRNVKYESGNAVAYGTSRDDALRAVTLAPAMILGIADRVGRTLPRKNT